ncbi:MAG: hypothetical protein C5B51_17290 [Terriglobia bacterium]|nr:MAG: hypothetical protein C5B51_17290 [Terriglobia bacterium]
MISTWNRLEGVSLAGQYGLRRWLGDSGDAAFFLTSSGPAQQPAIVKVVSAEGPPADLQLELWRCTASLSHPHLLRLLDYGRADVDGEAFIFAVFEYPDDTLPRVEERGPLSEAESRDVLVAAMSALRFIHSQGLVHTAVDAAHVVAVGNQIKLASDTLAEPSRTATTSGDVQALGSLLYQLLTGHPLESGKRPDVSAIPEPFRTIVLHSVEHDPNRRWTLAQISEALNPPPPQPSAPPPEVERPPVRPRTGSFPKWAYGAVAVLVALLIFLVAPKAPDVPVTKPVPQPSVPAPQSPRVSGAISPVTAPVGREYWRVIAYTYRGLPLAEKKVRSIEAKWPEARAEVFVPNGANRPPFLVALGGRMTRDEAVRWLKTARGKGMPRDTYIQNYSH